MPKADQPTSVRFSRETLEFLRREATRRRWGVSFLVRDIVEQYRKFTLRKANPPKASE